MKPPREKQTSPAFPQEVREKLAHGKYTSWAADLDMDTLMFLLHCVGEFSVRAFKWKPLHELLEAPLPKLTSVVRTGELREILALRAIRDIGRGVGSKAMQAWAEDLRSMLRHEVDSMRPESDGH